MCVAPRLCKNSIKEECNGKKCKDNENNRKNRNDRNGALLFNCIIGVF